MPLILEVAGGMAGFADSLPATPSSLGIAFADKFIMKQ
ncbi:hypothetical protein yrohd0001_7390 [Yersinia rohdei ATCC 43380]|nr:hypothetical protein yrohd0001_7390 [Yersinia rohdei ATCC 43380]